MIKTSVGHDLRDETQILHTLGVLRDIHKTVVPQGLYTGKFRNVMGICKKVWNIA